MAHRKIHKVIPAPPHSITSSARNRKPDEIERPIVLAVFKFTTSSNLYPIPESVTLGDSRIVASLIQHGEPRRFAMSAPIPLRQDFDASQLRGLAKKTKDGPQARRLLALAAIYDGATRTEAAKIGGVGASDHPGLGDAVQRATVRTGCWTANRRASPRSSMMPSAKPSRR